MMIRIATSFDAPIANLRNAAEHIKETNMCEAVKKCADEVMGIINRDVIIPLVHLFPDIDPDQ